MLNVIHHRDTEDTKETQRLSDYDTTLIIADEDSSLRLRYNLDKSMRDRKVGNSFGNSNRTISSGGITLTETEYNHEFVDWHYHENPHFTLVTRGNIRQGTRRETFECSADTLLFHNWQEPHYNIKPAGITRGFQVEISAAWYQKFEVDPHLLPAVAKITRPNVRLLFYNIYKESKIFDSTSTLTIDSLLLETFETMRGIEIECAGTPRWVKKLDEILHDNFDRSFSLQELSNELDLHWAHLSREFPRYFHCNFSQYVRKLKVEKSLALLRNSSQSIAEITFICGFADQSHFIRCFREFTGITPKTFRQLTK